MRRTAAALLLLAQLASIAYRRSRPEKYFCWAPYDQQTRCRIRAVVGGRELGQDELRRRYGLGPDWKDGAYWDQRAYGNVLGLIRQYEETRGRGDGASVTVAYSVNGAPERTWTWP